MDDALNDEFNKAIESLPAIENAAYLQALSNCPDLIRAESNPEWFLRIDGSKAPAAAKRLAAYWQRRVEAFGDQAFLPLATSLSEDDKEMLAREAFVRLPDSKGKPVLLLDLDRVGSADGFESSRTRLLFYWAWKLGMCASAQTDGIIVIRLFKRINFGTSNVRRRFALVDEAMPFRVHGFIMCCVLPPRDRKYFLRGAYPSAVKAFNECVPGRVQIHVAKTGSELLGRLVDFEPSGLPPSLGGSWGSPEESRLDPSGTAGATLDEQDRKRLKQEPERPPPIAAVPEAAITIHSTAEIAIPFRSTSKAVGPAAVLRALDQLRRSKNCTMSDLMMRPSIRCHALALLGSQSDKMAQPISMTSGSLTLAKPSDVATEHQVSASQAPFKKVLSPEQQDQKQKLKKRVLETMVARLKQEAYRSSATRSALASKIVQKLVTRRR